MQKLTTFQIRLNNQQNYELVMNDNKNYHRDQENNEHIY